MEILSGQDGIEHDSGLSHAADLGHLPRLTDGWNLPEEITDAGGSITLHPLQPCAEPTGEVPDGLKSDSSRVMNSFPSPNRADKHDMPSLEGRTTPKSKC